MDLNDETILGRFPVGYYSFHPNVSLNFQMNRFWNWVGDKQMLEELKAIGTRISNYDDWAREMFKLSDSIGGGTDLMLDGTVSFLGEVLAGFREGIRFGGIVNEPAHPRVPLRKTV